MIYFRNKTNMITFKLLKNNLLIHCCTIMFFCACTNPEVDVTTEITDTQDSKKEKENECDCSSVDDCISNFNFDCARKYCNQMNYEWDREKEMKKIIKGECIFYASQNEFDKAFSNVDELNIIIEDQNDLNDIRAEVTKLIIIKILNSKGPEEAIKYLHRMPKVGSRLVRNDAVQRKNELIDSIIDRLLEDGNYKLAKKLCLELPTQMLQGTYADGRPVFENVRDEALDKIEQHRALNNN